jgi:hypothetical protein
MREGASRPASEEVWTMQKLIAALTVLSLASALAGCASPCDELADLCGACVNEEAEAQCKKIVDGADADACQVAVDSKAYEAASSACSAK